MKKILLFSILGLILVGSSIVFGISQLRERDREIQILQDSIRAANILSDTFFTRGFEEAKKKALDDYKRRANESNRWIQLATQIADAQLAPGREQVRERIVIDILIKALAPWFKDLPAEASPSGSSGELQIQPAQEARFTDTTGPASLANYTTTLASIFCYRCQTIDTSSEEAACNMPWTCEEFYNDGWRYYRSATYCFRCIEAIKRDALDL
jgi:hypothetical protein